LHFLMLMSLPDDLEKFQQDEILRKVLSEGVDLRQYARQVEHDLNAAEEDSIQQFLNEVHFARRVPDNILQKYLASTVWFWAADI
jgi:hypothetical protein